MSGDCIELVNILGEQKQEVGILLFDQINCHGNVLSVTPTERNSLMHFSIPNNTVVKSMVIPENFKVRLHKSVPFRGWIDFNAPVWGVNIEDVSTTFDTWHDEDTGKSVFSSYEGITGFTARTLSSSVHPKEAQKARFLSDFKDYLMHDRSYTSCNNNNNNDHESIRNLWVYGIITIVIVSCLSLWISRNWLAHPKKNTIGGIDDYNKNVFDNS